MTDVIDHHEACVNGACSAMTPVLQVEVGRRPSGELVTLVTFPGGETLVAEAGNPDVGLDEPHTCLHDVAHTLLAARLALRSPVLERVVDLRPLSQTDVDLEEAAVFALQAWCLSLEGQDPSAALQNVRTALGRLLPGEA
jgi:hypothetical protein